MELNKLLEICKDLGIPYFLKSEANNNKNNRIFGNYRLEDAKRKGLKDYDIYESWMTGGVTGGSCWSNGDDDHYAITGDKEPEFTDLDNILAEICPSITFLQYKKVLTDLVEYSDYGEGEYYGNSTNYGVKKVNLVKLAGYLDSLIK